MEHASAESGRPQVDPTNLWERRSWLSALVLVKSDFSGGGGAMRVLCAIGRRGGVELTQRALDLAGANPELTLLYVIDSGPRRDLDQLTGPLRRGPLGGPARTRAIEVAE